MKLKHQAFQKNLLECLNSCHATATQYMCKHVRVCVCVCV